MSDIFLGLMKSGSSRRVTTPVLAERWKVAFCERDAQEGVMVFHIDDIDFSALTVDGFTYSSYSGWQFAKHLLPPVIINDCAYPIKGPFPPVGKVREIRTVLNPLLPNKWKVYQLTRDWEPIAPSFRKLNC